MYKHMAFITDMGLAQSAEVVEYADYISAEE